MQLAIGDVLEEKLPASPNLAPLVDSNRARPAWCHISEVSTDYVEDISQYLKKDQTVKVKVINITE